MIELISAAKVGKVLDIQAKKERKFIIVQKKALILYCIRARWVLLFIYFFSFSSVARPNSVSSHSPSLRPPSRARTPSFLSCAKSFSIVLAVIEVFSEIFSEIAFAETLESANTICNITI